MPESDTPRTGPLSDRDVTGVFITPRDIYDRVEALSSKVEVLLAMGTSHQAEHVSDDKRQDAQDVRLNTHGMRLGNLEKWKAAIPASLGLAITALIVKAFAG